MNQHLLRNVGNSIKHDLTKDEIKELQHEVDIAKEFAKKIERNTKDMPPEIAELIDGYFWELV